MQREQFWLVLQKLLALDDTANEAVQKSGEDKDGNVWQPLDEGGKAVGRQREQRSDRLEVLVVEEAYAHLRHLGCGYGVDLAARLSRGEGLGDGACLLRVGVKLEHARQDTQRMFLPQKVLLRSCSTLNCVMKRSVGARRADTEQGSGAG